MKTALRARITKALISFVCVFATCVANAESSFKPFTEEERENLALRIRKGAGIEVESYQKDSDTYVVVIDKERDVGPNVTTLEWLLEAIDNGMSAKTFRRKPERLVGSAFRLKKNLWLLSDEEIALRLKRQKEKK